MKSTIPRAVVLVPPKLADAAVLLAPGLSAKVVLATLDLPSQAVRLYKITSDHKKPVESEGPLENESLTTSLPTAMKAFIKAKLTEGSFSTPSEYTRSLIRADQRQSQQREIEAFVRCGLYIEEFPQLRAKDWVAVEAIVLRRSSIREAAKRARFAQCAPLRL